MITPERNVWKPAAQSATMTGIYQDPTRASLDGTRTGSLTRTLMLGRLLKLVTPMSLITLNVAIVLAVEFAGGGRFFVDTGLIHAMAILFILMSLAIVFVPYRLRDNIMMNLVRGSMAAMFVFALSHVAEFLGYMVFHLPEDAVFANVANFYLVSTFMILVGAEMFLRIHSERRSGAYLTGYLIGVAVFVTMAIAVYLDNALVSFDKLGPSLVFYTVSVLAAAAVGTVSLVRMRHVSSLIAEFSEVLRIALIFISLSTLLNIYYEILGDTFGLPSFQIINLAHFGFYASLSAMVFAFVQLSRKMENLGGIYADIKAAEDGAK